LIENYVTGRIDACGEKSGGYFPGVVLELNGILPDGYGVQVDHTIQAVIDLLHFYKTLYGPQIVAQMEVAGRLDA
jgi:hypothetical protein